MPGNEKKIAKFLVNNKGKLSFQHLGEVISIGAPGSTKGQYVEINTDD